MAYTQQKSPTSLFVLLLASVLIVMFYLSLKLQSILNVPFDVSLNMTFNTILVGAFVAFTYWLIPEWFESTLSKLTALAIMLIAFFHPLVSYLKAEAGGVNLQTWWFLLSS